MLRPVLDKSQFEFDDDRTCINVRIPLTPEDLKQLDSSIFQIIGDGWAVEPKTPIAEKMRKIRTELIKYDGDTIKADQYDQLYVDGDEVLDKQSVRDRIREICREEIDRALALFDLSGVREMIENLVLENLLGDVMFNRDDFKVHRDEDGKVKVSIRHKHHFPGPVFPGYEEFYKTKSK